MDEPELDCTCAYVPVDPYPLRMRQADPECPEHAGQPDGDVTKSRDSIEKEYEGILFMDDRDKKIIREAVSEDLKNQFKNPNYDKIDEILADTSLETLPGGYTKQEHLDYASTLYGLIEFKILPDEPVPCSCCERGNFIGTSLREKCTDDTCNHHFSKHN